jgi:hypothetical protein
MKRRVDIPTSFKQFGKTVKVLHVHTLLEEEQAAAKVYPDQNVIKVQSISAAYNIPEEQRVHNFYHELVHLLFINAGYSDDYADEQKVDLMAGLLHQALVTMEFPR